MEDIISLKQSMRTNMAQLKKSVSTEEGGRLSNLVMLKVEQMEEFVQASTILLYYSLPDEVQTASFLEKWADSKRFVLPVVEGENLILKEYKHGMLKSGYKSILEPTETTIVQPEDIDLALVPGVAFDLQNNRLGRGKGFYDRLLPLLKCKVFGLAYPFQVVDKVPTELFDKKLDGVISIDI